MREKRIKPGENLDKYFKVIWIDLKNNEFDIWKAPADEIRLMEMLRDDYNSSRYGKWLGLIANERIEEEDKEFFLQVFSENNIKKAFRRGKKQLEYAYVGLMDGKYQRIRAKILCKSGWRMFPREILIYVEGDSQ